MSNVVRAPIQPKSQVHVPRDLIMMNIAKKQNEIAQRNREHTNRSHNAHFDSLMQSTHLDPLTLPQKNNLMLPPLNLGPKTSRND